jgi:AAHS family 4-hydroxybenzoate transporter-like MFS transporter
MSRQSVESSVKRSDVEAGRAAPVDVTALIDGRPIGAYQVGILLLLACAIVMDGFDVQAMGFVAPAIVDDWKIEVASLGPIFSASLVGMLIGSIVLGSVADRVGRRPVLIGATIFFGCCMLATAAVNSVPQLMAARFVTGLGLGGVLGNAVALATEFSPRRRRATILMALSCGFTGGAITGGLASAALIPVTGWQSVFVVGGVIPLLVGLLMLRFLPESLQFALVRGRGEAVLARVAPGLAPGDLRAPASDAKGGSVAGLFRHGRGLSTLILWTISFANLLNLFFLANWLPMLAVRMGFTAHVPVLLGTTLQLGGVIGALAMGPLMDRYGFRWVMTVGFAMACAAIALIGQAGMPLAPLVALVLTAGFGVVGAQPAINAVAASLYPMELRATGIGWSLGVGRAGAIVGPLVAAELIAFHWSNQQLFLAAAAPAALSCLLVCLLGLLVARR